MTPEPKRPLKVFLCHAHADRDPVRGLYARLTQDGVDAWLDKEKLLPGQDWELEIRKAVREADVVVVCLSKQFNQAGFRQKEVRLALDTAMEKPEGEIFIIPARLEECDTLESLRKWHWVDLFEDDGYEMLMHALRARANKISATLQTKKSWSPIGNIQPAVIKKPTPPVEKPVEKKREEPKSEKRIQAPAIFNKALIGIGVIVLLTFVVVFGYSVMNFPKPSFATATSVITDSPTITFAPTVFNPYPDSSDLIDSRGVPMRLVPSGNFISEGFSAGDNYLLGFYIDKFEITNAQYQACVDSGICSPPQDNTSDTRSIYYGNSEFDNYPVIYVDWFMAKKYCEWRNSELPTVLQFEKAAQGTDGRNFPWGDSSEGCAYANYGGDGKSLCKGDTTMIGLYGKGVSPYQIYDLIGNVYEWSADGSDWETYVLTPDSAGPSSTMKELCGSAWSTYGSDGLAPSIECRYGREPTFADSNIGFRCAKSAP